MAQLKTNKQHKYSLRKSIFVIHVVNRKAKNPSNHLEKIRKASHFHEGISSLNKERQSKLGVAQTRFCLVL